MWISGCCWNQAKTAVFQSAHALKRAAPSRSRTALESGQLVCAIDSPRQPRSWATTSSAARQWLAWLSPTSAIVSVASSGAAPKLQTFMSAWRSTSSQGELGIVAASAGRG